MDTALQDAARQTHLKDTLQSSELKKRMLTNLYNQRPAWLANAHAAFDRAVWDAYGWPEDEVPAEAEDDVILGRLLVLNQERSQS